MRTGKTIEVVSEVRKPGIDYQETFSPVVRLDMVRIILALVTQNDLEIVI